MVDRRKEDTVDMAFRPWRWQRRSHEKVSEILGCDKKDVVYSAYILGLKELREGAGEDHKALSTMANTFRNIVENSIISGEGMEVNEERLREIDEVDSKMDTRHVKMNDVPGGELGNPRTYDARNTAYAEVQEDYVDGSMYWSGFHKVVAALGLERSSQVDGDVKVRIGSLGAFINESVEETREYIETVAVQFASSMYTLWIQDGLELETYELWLDFLEMMETDEKEKLNGLLTDAEKYVVEQDEDEDDD